MLEKKSRFAVRHSLTARDDASASAIINIIYKLYNYINIIILISINLSYIYMFVSHLMYRKRRQILTYTKDVSVFDI